MISILLNLLLLIQISTQLSQNNTQLSKSPITKRLHQHFFKDKSDGCMLKENNQFAVWYGPDCKKYPSNYTIKEKNLKIRMTAITKIGRDDFINLTNLTMLVLEHNLELSTLEAGCFRHLKNLTHLKMILNYKITVIEEGTFEGLESLTHLILRKNGFTNIKDVFGALIANQVPNLVFLDLSENVFKWIDRYDLKSMAGSKVEELQLSLASIRFINNESLVVFKNLKTLGIDGNHFYTRELREVISNFVKFDIQLESLNLQDSGYRRRTPLTLMKTIARTTISKISLAQNQLEVIDKKSFPRMPKIRSLDLRDNIIITIADDAFKKLTALEELYLAGNKFPKIYSAILLPSLKLLDVCRISNKPTAVSYFTIEDNVFTNMTNLEVLDLSYNLLESTNPKTFSGLINLKYLDMKNTTVFNIRENSFRNTPNLTYLNLENNPFKIITLNSENFAGLPKLETLLIGGSKIANLSSFPSPFANLKSLVYLGLNSNVIYTLDAHVFSPLSTLQVLDLSSNRLIPWSKRLFSNNSLKFLDLSMNKFTSVTRAMLEDLKNIPEYNVDDNPFICDCKLFPADALDEVLSNRNYTNILDVNCSNLLNYTIKDFVLYLKSNTSFCQKLEPKQSTRLVVIIVTTIVVSLFVTLLVLSYYYRYYLQYWFFLIKMASRRHSRWWKRNSNSCTISFQYDAFVSYSCTDSYFVSELVSKLENHEPYLKLCVYERDFKIGSIISEEIMQNIVKSKRTLLIISDGFAKSQWCRWETKLAEHQQLFFNNDDSISLDDTLVMVKLNDVSKKYITPTLKYLMKTRIYLEWNKSKEQEFWNKLRNTLAAPKYCCKIEKE